MDISKSDIYEVNFMAALTLDDGVFDSAYLIMLSLREPSHGYAIMQYADRMTSGAIKLGPATLYTTLKKLEKIKYICAVKSDDSRRKLYQLTEAGISVLIKEIEKRGMMANLGRIFMRDLQRGDRHE